MREIGTLVCWATNILVEVMSSIAEEERVKNHQRQEEGIAAAKAKGVKFGRPSLTLPDNYQSVMGQVAEGRLKSSEAMEMLNLKRTSYYKLKKLYLAEGVKEYAGIH